MKKFPVSWHNPKITSKYFEKYKGMGAFAKKKINKGEVLTYFGGYVMTKKDFFKLPKDLQDYAYHITDNLLFGVVNKSEVSVGEHYNHSCDPNSGFKDVITLVALRDISPGEEITFDYCICMTSDIVKMKCVCGAKNCRKIIKGTDWKNKELQKKYKNYFQPYIKEKIRILNKRKI